ncbi:hypothetical protein [Sphaerisporangium fuscum]|uniref:hypothetical protein n=1 Tax=Sphaerisporangium fuscum TaxID=2835868 RepID=UPI001BDDAEB5|nr:hypothetical protein [Sphaerisporangium fuscum]
MADQWPIGLRHVAFRVEMRQSADDEWREEAWDAMHGRSAKDVAASICRDYASAHRDQWVQVSVWDLCNLLLGHELPEVPSLRLAWLKSLEDERIWPHHQVMRPPSS